MKKFVLVPESQHRQTINKSDVLQGIHQPEQREMLKRYQLAQDLLHDAKRTNNETKMDEYHEAMQDFSLLRDRQTHRQLPQKQPLKRAHDKVESSNSADSDADVVDALPTSQQANARKLMRLLRAQGDDILSWTPNGEVRIQGKRLRGTNIVDLVGDVVRSTPSKTSAPERERFLNALAEANVPETLVKNKNALERYRAIKTGGTTVREITDDYDENDEDATVSSTTTKNDVTSSKKKKETTKKKTIASNDWNSPL